MEVLTRILAAGALMAAAGCSFLRDPTPVEATGEQASVHALLVTGSDTVRVLLQRVGSGAAGQDPVAARPVSGAEVLLEAGGGSVRLAETPTAGCIAQSLGAAVPSQTAGCYAAVLPGGVRAGAGYALRIRLPGGGAVEGRATALPALRLESHPAGTRIFVASRTFSGEVDESTRVPLRLRGAERAPGAAVEFVPRVVYSRGQALTEFYCSVEYARGAVYPRDAQGDLSLRLFGVTCVPRTPNGTPPDPQFRVDSVRAALRVVAFDSAYTRYVAIQQEDAVSLRDAAAGVTGAIGLFAAASRAETEVVLIPCIAGQTCP